MPMWQAHYIVTIIRSVSNEKAYVWGIKTEDNIGIGSLFFSRSGLTWDSPVKALDNFKEFATLNLISSYEVINEVKSQIF